ncbi:MAG: sialidase family protein [bacterium]
MRRHAGMTYTPDGDILVMANGGKAYRSSDHGTSWSKATTARFNSGCLSLLTHGNTLWGFDRVSACSGDNALGSRRSTDNGESWDDPLCLQEYPGKTGDANHIDGFVDGTVLNIVFYWNGTESADQRIQFKRYELNGGGGL